MKEPVSVLVVDDNPDLLNTLALILKRKGYKVETALDGLTALVKFKASHFNVILMDILMPGMDGVEAFRRMRLIDPDAKVILMTAYSEEEQIADAVNEGAFSALHKPVNIARLIELIGEAADSPLILIVDDDADFRHTMARVMELKGFRVATAGSAEEAVLAARERICRIAFIDVKMPPTDGLQTLLRLKELNPDMMAVMMTGYRNEVGNIVAQALASQAAACLYKPFDFGEVVELVSQYREPGSVYAGQGQRTTR